MRRRLRFGRRCLPLVLAGLLTAGLAAAAAQETEPVRATSAGRAAPEAGTSEAAASVGAVRLERMVLLLQPGAEQKARLDALLAAQQTPGNPSFHRWLTSAQFAERFAVSAEDAAKVAAWLKAQGFSVAPLPASRGWVEFSGTLSQVEQAFGAPVEAIPSSSGVTRYRLAGRTAFPAAIASLAGGLVSLDGRLSAPAATPAVEIDASAEAPAAETAPSKTSWLTPALARSGLHLSPLPADAAGGLGESIAVVARSTVRTEDFAAFRSTFGLPNAPLEVALSGPDPGRTAEEAATIEAASWASAAAPGAHILLVAAGSTNVTDGVDLALAEAVDGALAHTISLGFSACEASLSPAHQAFYGALYRQAAAEGIAIVAATGDSGAAACHASGDRAPVSSGWGVNGLASTPWNLAVGAAAISADGSGLTAWQPAGAGDRGYAGGGGASEVYAAPDWQSAAGLPLADPGTGAARHRDLPDVSLPAAADARRGVAFCFAGENAVSGCRLVGAGGSAASAAIFAGIAAVLAQKYGPQGNLAPNLYALSRRTASSASGAPAILDIASGSAKLPCVLGTTGCSAASEGEEGWGEIGFPAAPGYDFATGLGSVDAEALVAAWTSPQTTGTAPVTVEMTGPPSATYNPSSDLTLTAKVLSGSGGTVPAGTVQFFDTSLNANAGPAVTLTASGTASYTEDAQFAQGGHDIVAKYSGDSTYEAATSAPLVLTIEPSPSTLTVTPSTTTPAGGSTITVTGTVTATDAGNSPPTGTVTVNLDGLPQGTAPLTTVAGVTSAMVNVTVPSAGSHAVQGIYSGDTNYDQATSAPVTIAVVKSATVTSISATPSTLTAGVPESLTATIAPAIATTAPYTITGTVSFYDGGATLLGTATITGNTAVLAGVNLSVTATHTLTAVYSGDANYSASTSSPLLLTATLLPVTVTLAESNTVLAPEQPVTLTATVTPVNAPPLTAEQHPSGYVLFYAGTTLISGQVPIAVSTGYSSVGSTVVPHLAAGQYVVTAQYFGDATYGPAVSNSLSLQAEDFTITCNAPDGTSNLSVRQGGTVSATCYIASLGGLTGAIQIACAEQNPPQVGALGCSLDPSVVNANGKTTLTIVTTAGNLSALQPGAGSVLRPGKGRGSQRGPALWTAMCGGTALAFASLLLLPAGWGARLLRRASGRVPALALLFGGLALAGLGCNNGIVPTNNGGTPLGVHTVKIMAAADVDTVTVSHLAYLTVNVTP